MKRNISFALLALIVFASCKKEVSEPVVEPQTDQNLVTIYAAIDDTKSVVNTSTGEFSWIAGEAISVAPESGTEYNNTFTCSTPAEGAFTGTGTPGDIAISPAQTGTYTSATNFQVAFPATYTWADGVTNALMVGTKVSDSKYQFKHAGALMVVTYENVPENTYALRVVSTTASQKLTGTVALAGTAIGDIQIANNNAGLTGNQVDINFTKTTGNVASRTFYVPVPTGHYDEITFSLVNDDDAVTASTVKTLKNADIARTNVVVFPTISLVAGFAPPVTVGNTDNSSGWESAWSSLYTIEKGKVLHLEFVNYSSKANNWNNWVLFVTNNKPFIVDAAARNASGYAEYFALRCDNHGWGANYSTNRLYSNYNWASFLDDMDGATINMTIEYTTLGSILVKAKSSTGYEERYTHPVPLGDGNIGAFLWCDNSHYVIKKAWYTDSKKTSITGIESAYNYYVYNTALELDTIGWPKDVVATYNDGDKAGIMPSAITFPTGQTLAASAGNQVYNVTYNESNYNFTIPVIMGTGAFGSTTLTTLNWTDSWSAGYDVANNSSLAKRMFVYSRATENYNGPYAHVCTKEWTGQSVFVWNGNAWNDKESTAFDNIDANKSFSDGYWTNFVAQQTHALTTITWTNNGTSGSVNYSMKAWNGTTRSLTFNNINLINGMCANCAAEHCYVVMID